MHDQTDLFYRKPVQGDVRPLYTTPPAAQRQWVGLTDDEIGVPSEPIQPNEALMFARVIEALLKEKNT